MYARKLHNYVIRFNGHTIQSSYDRFFERSVCEVLNLGVVGIFGPQEKVISDHVQSICDVMEVPHISVRQDSNESPQPRGLTLNLYPHVSSLARVSK
jgi:ionotropic kainate glutamate receptor 3